MFNQETALTSQTPIRSAQSWIRERRGLFQFNLTHNWAKATPVVIPPASSQSLPGQFLQVTPSNALIIGAELLVQCLENQGVRYVFGPLEEEASLIAKALRESSIQFIATRHSRGAASMAHVYSRLTGQTGVCLAKSAQNSLDLLPGVVEAHLHNIPLVAITEQTIAEDLPLDSRDVLDLVSIFEPGLKWSQHIDQPEKIAAIVHQAFQQAQTTTKAGQPGAAHINLPEAIAVTAIAGLPLKPIPSARVVPVPPSFEQAAAWISKALIPLRSGRSGVLPSTVRKSLKGQPTSAPLKLSTQSRGNAGHPIQDIHIPFKPQTLIQTLQAVLHPQDILLADGGIHPEWLLCDDSCEFSSTCLTFHESASAGLTISGAIAAKLVRPRQNVITVTSVNGFMAHYPELEPARWLKTPFVTLICNPGGWYPNFVEIAKSMGFTGYRVTSSEGLIATLETALAQDTPTIIDCPVDYRDHSA